VQHNAALGPGEVIDFAMAKAFLNASGAIRRKFERVVSSKDVLRPPSPVDWQADFGGHRDCYVDSRLRAAAAGSRESTIRPGRAGDAESLAAIACLLVARRLRILPDFAGILRVAAANLLILREPLGTLDQHIGVRPPGGQPKFNHLQPIPAITPAIKPERAPGFIRASDRRIGWQRV
jgi:hypothetical protein